MRCSLLTLSSYLDDELDATRRAEVEAHLLGCERCHKGLEYLREEVSRIGSLARVHIPDEGVRALLDQLGLIGPDDELPPRPPRPSTPPGDDPPWFSGAPAGGTLPWTPRRDAEPDRASDQPSPDQPSLPFTARAPLGPRFEPGRDAPAAADTEVQLTGRPSEPRVATQSSPGEPAPPPPLRLPRPTGVGVLRIDGEPPISPAETTDHSFTGQLRDGPRLPPTDRVEGDPKPPPPATPGGAAEDPWSWVVHERPDPDSPRAGPGLPGDPPEDHWSWTVHVSPAVNEREDHGDTTSADPWSWEIEQRPSSDPNQGHAGSEPPSTAFEPDDDPWSLVGREHPAPADLEGHPEALPPSPAIPGFELPQWDELPAAPPYPLPPLAAEPGGNALPGVLDDPGFARRPPSAPPAMIRPSPLARLRDRVALRLALMRRTEPVEAGEEVGQTAAPPPARVQPGPAARLTAESWAGLGAAPAEPPAPEPPAEPGPPPPAPLFPFRPPATRDPGSLAEQGRPGPSRAMEWKPAPVPAPPAAGARIPLGQRDHEVAPPLRKPTSAEELPGPARRAPIDTSLPPAGPPRGPGRHTKGLYSGVQGRMAASAMRLHPRWIAVAVAALLLVVIVVLATHAGVSPQATAGGTLPRSTPTSAGGPSGAPSQPATAPASAAPSAPVSATASATAAPSAASPAQTFGAGGSGWQIQHIQCCKVQPPKGGQAAGYTRVVFDFSADEGQAPTVTVTYPSATTMVINFSEVTVSGSTPSLSGGVVTSMVPIAGSRAAFQLTLSRPAKVKGWGFTATGYPSDPSPLMYFDLG